jgi:hypothetical protein
MEPFKIQRPLSGDLSRALIYNRSRSVILMVPIKDVIGLFDCNELKAYWRGEIDIDCSFKPYEKIKQQNW